MAAFVRKNLIVIASKFEPPGYAYWNRATNAPNPPPTQPTAAEAVLSFKNPSGVQTTATVTLALQTDGITWSGIWDSSAAGPGVVTWVVYASGAVQAAQQGQFVIQANQANTF